jgi:hypothetical protein
MWTVIDALLGVKDTAHSAAVLRRAALAAAETLVCTDFAKAPTPNGETGTVMEKFVCLETRFSRYSVLAPASMRHIPPPGAKDGIPIALESGARHAQTGVVGHRRVVAFVRNPIPGKIMASLAASAVLGKSLCL